MILLWTREVSTGKALVVGKHYLPFDPVYGVKHDNGNSMTKEEMEAMGGVFVETELQPEANGLTGTHYVNPETKEQFYEYEEMPKSDIEILREENAALKKSQADQDELLMQLMLGGN